MQAEEMSQWNKKTSKGKKKLSTKVFIYLIHNRSRKCLLFPFDFFTNLLMSIRRHIFWKCTLQCVFNICTGLPKKTLDTSLLSYQKLFFECEWVRALLTYEKRSVMRNNGMKSDRYLYYCLMVEVLKWFSNLWLKIPSLKDCILIAFFEKFSFNDILERDCTEIYFQRIYREDSVFCLSEISNC